MAETKTDIDTFTQLSSALTGAAKLDAGLAEAYLARLRAEFPAQTADILTAFSTIAAAPNLVFEVKRRIVEDKAQGALAQQINAIWFTSEFIGADGKPKTGTQTQFNSGLIWKVIRAYAPANSNLNYGDWRNPPAAQ